MSGELKNQRVAILATDDFEQSELTEPLKMLCRNGAAVDTISLHSGKIQGMQHQEKSDKIRVDIALDRAKADNYAALFCCEASPIPTCCASVRVPFIFCANSSMPRSQSQQSAMRRGH